MKYLVTGGMGFIGSNLIRHLLQNPANQVRSIDAFTYAARPEWVLDYTQYHGVPISRFMSVKGDLADAESLNRFIESVDFDAVIHLAAESHVCRSIEGPDKFIRANINGTFNLLEACRRKWKSGEGIFHHVSTDEVFGTLNAVEPAFDEDTQIKPTSPYAASKAASDHLVLAYSHTYGMNVRVSNCSNNFGPNQHEEKLIPRTILKLLRGEEMTVYGTGEQVRDWIWVDDHVEGILKVMERGRAGERYCLGGNLELSNLEVIGKVHESVQRVCSKNVELKIRYTNDRPTDDLRYAIDSTKALSIGWTPYPRLFESRLDKTVEWYARREARNV